MSDETYDLRAEVDRLREANEVLSELVESHMRLLRAIANESPIDEGVQDVLARQAKILDVLDWV